MIVSVGKSAIAIGIPRKEVLPIKPANCSEKFGNIFFNAGILLIKAIKKTIEIKANKAELIKSMLIPAFKSKPITLMGMPNFIKLIDIFSEAMGLTLPIKNPNTKNGIISINNLLICLTSKAKF